VWVGAGGAKWGTIESAPKPYSIARLGRRETVGVWNKRGARGMRTERAKCEDIFPALDKGEDDYGKKKVIIWRGSGEDGDVNDQNRRKESSFRCRSPHKLEGIQKDDLARRVVVLQIMKNGPGGAAPVNGATR